MALRHSERDEAMKGATSAEGIEGLRYAIVEQAIRDYARALRGKQMADTSLDMPADDTRRECEMFFTGVWFSRICDLDGRLLMAAMRRKYGCV